MALIGQTLLALGLAAGRAAGAELTPPETVNAELLRDLDVLLSDDYAQESRLGSRLRVIERLRLLEMLCDLERRPPPAPPAGAARPGPGR